MLFRFEGSHKAMIMGRQETYYERGFHSCDNVGEQTSAKNLGYRRLDNEYFLYFASPVSERLV